MKNIQKMHPIFKTIPTASIARHLKVSQQRAHVMCKNPDVGDNRRRVNEALREVAGEIEKYLNEQKER